MSTLDPIMLAGYIDESGTHDTAAALSVAITVSDLEGWGAWGRAWMPHSESVGHRYHAKQHQRLHGTLTDLMLEHTLFSSYVTVNENTYREKYPEWVTSVIGGAYPRLLLITLMSASQWAQESRRERMFYFIEQGHRNFSRVEHMMAAIMRSGEAREMFWMEGWGVATKADLPIACPDTLAYLSAAWNNEDDPLLDKLAKAGILRRGEFTDDLLAESLPQFVEVARRTKADIRRSREERRRKNRDPT